jgi:predicted RNA-binding Zn-ribbon protein involved in translation (DUF1610 family)
MAPRPPAAPDSSGDPRPAGVADGVAAVRWAPLVEQGAIRRLYETDALGIVDEAQIDAVGYALEARCRSILRATEAHLGRVTCPRCEHLIDRGATAGAQPDQVVSCPRCGWRVRWRDYFKTYQHKHLVGGGAVTFHQEFVARFERARTPQEKMLAIDRLIHAFHWELVREPARAAARELIRARSYKELLTFLDGLTYGEGSTPGLQEGKAEWDRKADSIPWHGALKFREGSAGESPPPAPPIARPGPGRGSGSTAGRARGRSTPARTPPGSTPRTPSP